MHPSPLRLAARRSLGVLPVALLLLLGACDATAPHTIGGYCRRDLDCVPGLRCLAGQCSERLTQDAGGPRDQGQTPDANTDDTGTVDMSMPDTGTPDTGTPDMGTPDTGPEDMGPQDMGPEDMGPADTGTDGG